jgi:hypothetical protein
MRISPHFGLLPGLRAFSCACVYRFAAAGCFFKSRLPALFLFRVLFSLFLREETHVKHQPTYQIDRKAAHWPTCLSPR